jgi:RNA recognition motif. (a.k.a. RRM, RBD, or RNP domain)
MAKRDREENLQVLLQGFGSNVKADDIASVFCKFGRIDSIRFLGRRNCIVQYDQSDSAAKALQLHNTKQLSLYASMLSVTSQDNNKPHKKSHLPPGSFILLDPPRFNNYLIPVLPSFLSN